MLLVAFRHLTYVLYIERFQSERVSLNAQTITSSLLVRLTNALTAVLRLASQTPRPDRYRHLDLNRIYLLRCSLRRCAVVTIASSCTIVAAAPSPAAARHCHCLVARACHGPVAI